MFTVEFGASVPGRGYIGLEEDLLVTADGVEWLSTPTARALARAMTRLAPLALVAALLVVAAPAAAAPIGTARHTTQLGILGDPGRFLQLTAGQRSEVLHAFIGWDQPRTIPKPARAARPLPMLALKTGPSVTPLDIAQGRGDGFRSSRSTARWRELRAARLRPPASGDERPLERVLRVHEELAARRARGDSTAGRPGARSRASPSLARGGPAAELNPKLRKLGGPPLGGDLPRTQARIVWNPQGYGAPDIPANAAAAYYPGDAYVDVVANDLDDQGFKAAWEANDKLYAAHPGKPYAIGEWGLWGIDDPPYVERMAAFVRTHGRIEFVSYFNSKPGSLWYLASKPRSRAAYRRVITPLGG